MAVILPVRNIQPQFGQDCFIATNATIVGEVEAGNLCSFWFNSVVRGDVNFIKIGNKVNVQDCAVIHCTYQKAGTTIGNNVTIGHSAIVHGCTIHDNVLVGMGSIIMDNAVVHRNAIIAAGAVVLQHTIIEAGWIYAGAPAKKVKQVSSQLLEEEVKGLADKYVLYASWFKNPS